MGTQLSIFDFLPASESQVDEIPVIKNNLVAFPIKKEDPHPDPFDMLTTAIGLVDLYGPGSNDWAELPNDVPQLQAQIATIDDLFAQLKKRCRWDSDLENSHRLEQLTIMKVRRVAQIREKIRTLSPAPLTKAEEFPHLSAEVLACVSDLHRQPLEYRQQLAKDLADYFATPDEVLKERLGVLPNTVVVEIVAVPKPEPVQLTPVRWSVARGETHLMAPGEKSPICGAPDGREGAYTATGEPYSWQSCVRGLTPMCAACERLANGA